MAVAIPAVPTAAGVQTHGERDARRVAESTRRLVLAGTGVPPCGGAAVVTGRSAFQLASGVLSRLEDVLLESLDARGGFPRKHVVEKIGGGHR